MSSWIEHVSTTRDRFIFDRPTIVTSVTLLAMLYLLDIFDTTITSPGRSTWRLFRNFVSTAVFVDDCGTHVVCWILVWTRAKCAFVLEGPLALHLRVGQNFP